jgi:hypothetical protein
MKTKIKIEQEVEITKIIICVHVRYGEENIPNDFPMRHGDLWKATVDIDTGRIEDWPIGKSGNVTMKVCDEGTYTLVDSTGKRIAELENEYVPHGIVPGKYGDYINLEINDQGVIINWPKHPDISTFFRD